MQIKKEDLAKKLEDLSKSLNEKYRDIVKDLSNAIMFLSLYCGNKLATSEEIQIDLKKLLPNIKNEKFEKAQRFFIKSYDDTQSMEIIFSKSYIKIENKKDNDFYYYLVEYFLEGKNFIRKVKQKSMPLDKELVLEEKSQGKEDKGIYYSEISEKNQNMNLVFVKMIDKNKVENIYYSYYTEPKYKLFLKVSKEYKEIPTINSFGVAELTKFLELQFENKFIKFEDEELFNSLVKVSKEYYA
jgi:lipopolysaccharide export LptBFGC system permease protein LptF